LSNSNTLAIQQTLEEEKCTIFVEHSPVVTLTYTEGTSLRGVKNVMQYSATQFLQSKQHHGTKKHKVKVTEYLVNEPAYFSYITSVLENDLQP
jgi:hypothetical protein